MLSELERLLRPAPFPRRIRVLYRRPYYPFSEPNIRLRNIVSPVKRLASARRDFSVIANLGLLSGVRPRVNMQLRRLPLPVDITSGADRRLWRPADRAVNVYGQQVSPTDVLRVKPRSMRDPDWEKIMNPPKKINWRPRFWHQLQNAPWWYGFVNADKVVICLKRKIRREIMHALGIAGKTGQNPPRFNKWSHVRC